MSDLFAPLREPEPVTSLPPDEVRRRGDRLRRRRAGLTVAGAVVAAAIVVGGPSLVVGDRRSHDAPSRPVDSPSARAMIPGQFDLADGMPRDLVSSQGVPPLTACGEELPLGDRALATEGVGQAATGDFTTRALLVYPDAATARSVARNLVTAFEDCPRFTDPRNRVWTTSVGPTAQGDQGWVVAQAVESPGTRVDFPEVVQVVRLGENLLVTRQREIHGLSVGVMSDVTGDQVASLMHLQMCLLTDEGCAWRSDPDVLRPDGWGRVQLRMSREEVESSGVAELGEAEECTPLDLGTGHGWFSDENGLVRIQVPEGVTTPDGIGVGASRDQVVDAYPLAEGKDVMVVRASPTADYEMTVASGRVTRLALSSVGVDCVG